MENEKREMKITIPLEWDKSRRISVEHKLLNAMMSMGLDIPETGADLENNMRYIWGSLPE